MAELLSLFNSFAVNRYPFHFVYFRPLFLCLLVFTISHSIAPAPSHATDAIILHDGIDYYPMGRHVEYLEDRSGSLTISDVSSPVVAGKFVQCDRDIPNFGLKDTIIWFRFRIEDQSTMRREWVLEQGFPLMRSFDLFFPGNNGSFEVILGDGRAFSSKVLPHRNPLFLLPDITGTETCYIRASVGSLAAFPLAIHSREGFLKKETVQLLGFGLYFGAMLAMALYNLYLYIFIRDRVYLYYVLYAVTFSVLQMTLHGFCRQFLFPDSQILDHYVMRLFIVLPTLASLLFSRRFLKADQYAPQMDRLLKILIAADLLLLPVIFTLPVLPSLIILDINTLLTPLLAAITGIVCYFRGYKPARYYLAARACLYTSVCAFVIDNTFARRYNFFSWYGMLVGSVLDVVLLSLALADRVSVMRREKEKAEAEAVRAGSRALIGEMAAGVAHEVNNPLAGVILCFKGIIKSREGDPEREELIKAVDTGLVKIQNTVAHLLNFSRMSSMGKKAADINALIHDVLLLCKYQLAKANIEVVTSLAPELPRLSLDENKMGQVLVNLVLNASQAMQGGGTLSIRSAKEGAWCMVSVTDTGEGIAPEVLPRIFEPFFTTKDAGKGTGLGLSLSKNIVDAHGGRINVASTHGAGTTCSIHLPLEA